MKLGTPSSASKITATVFALLIVGSFVRPAWYDSTMPLLWPIINALVSVILLYAIQPRSQSPGGFMRIGFYVGMFAFFLSFPILAPDTLDGSIPSEIHTILGWALLLTICGFEVMYWLVSQSRRSKRISRIAIDIHSGQRRWLMVLVCLGLTAWFLSVWDYANALNAPITSVLLTMRGVVEGAQQDIPSAPSYLSLALSAGMFLAASAATVLLTACRQPIRNAVICWLAIIACALVGFLSGSRANFLYTAVPLAVTTWKRLSRLGLFMPVRWLGLGFAIALLIVVWGAMTTMRGTDIRKYEAGLEEISPVVQAQSALDVYSMTATVIEIFPDRIRYVYGESLIPLVAGWIPRPLWPNKPYPFSLYMNIAKGESLQSRAASLAVGVTGEGYGNFGLFGTFLWGALLGLACRFGDKCLARFQPEDPFGLLLAGMGAIWVAMIVRGGVPEMFYMGLQIIILPIGVATFLSLTRRMFAQELASRPHLGVTSVTS